MKTELEIRDRIHAIVTDPRYRAPPADMMINTPLAIVQSGFNSEVRALSFVLDYSEDFMAGEDAAATLIRRYGLEQLLANGAHFIESDEYMNGFRAVVEDYQREQKRA